MTISGSCECSAVMFELAGKLRQVIACHCTQCRKTSGHYWAATSVPTRQLKLVKSSSLKWYRSSDKARRGFCTGCGSSLFYELDGEGRTAVGAGTLKTPNGLKTMRHIYVADKGDYYSIADNTRLVANAHPRRSVFIDRHYRNNRLWASGRDAVRQASQLPAYIQQNHGTHFWRSCSPPCLAIGR